MAKVLTVETNNTTDITAPIITLLGDNPQTLELGSTYLELNATTNDNSSISINSSAVDMNTVGEYNVIYNAKDSSDNHAQTVIRKVIVSELLVDSDDGIIDSLDNCLLISNVNQINTDNDNEGNVCDNDDDNDGISDIDEIKWGFNPLDASDGHDADADGDGVSNKDEIRAGANPLDANDTKKPKKFASIIVGDLIIIVKLPE